jgi:hemerythrin-like domain-containing protein
MLEHPSPSTIRDRFLHDHHELEDLFDGLLDAFEANDREGIAELWTLFEERLNAHMDAEERLLLAPLARSCPREARALFHEHRHIRSRLAALSCEVDLHTIRLASARAFVDELRAHARREDEVLYDWADRHLGVAAKHSLLHTLSAPFQGHLRRTG